MRVGISLALSALFAQAVCAEVCPASSTRQASDLTVNKDTVCEINTDKTVDKQVTNDGTIVFTSGGKITFENSSSGTITIGNGATNGIIQVKGNATIDASKANGEGLKVEGQDISVDKNYALTLKATKITFGGNSGNNKFVTISGDSYVHSSTSYKNILLDTTQEIILKDLSLTNVRMSGSALTSIVNTKLTLNNAYITSDAELTIKGESSSSTFIVQKDSKNTISAKNITFNTANATHTFQGEGIIDFQAGIITLGASGQTATLKQEAGDATKEGAGQTTVGFIADTQLLATKLEVEGIKMQVVKNSEATLSNVESTFKGATLQALDRDDKDQVLVIENGNSTLATVGQITIGSDTSKNTITTFMGSGIKIYGQEITINGDSTKSNTLSLQTIDDSGEITLGKKNSESTTPPPPNTPNKDGDVTIKGQNNNSDKKTLQLRGTTTTIGGSVTLQDLSIQTHSSNEGMVFSQGEDGSLTLNNINLTSGIKDDKGEGNYQSLSFASENTGGITLANDSTSTLSASEFSFTNQNISLANSGSGSTLKLYAYGKTSLDNSQTNDALGLFSFDSTTISDGSASTLSLYTHKGAKLSAHHLTLDGVAVESKTINGSGNTEAPIDLSSTSNDITIKNSVSINASKFLYGDTQGIGADITIIGGSTTESLTLKASESGDSFTFGGTLTFDNSANSGATSTLSVELNNNKTENKQISLNINGGLTAIGNATSGGKTTLTAKSFTFGAGSVVSSINGELELDATTDGINIANGTTILQGLSGAEGKISKKNGSGELKLGNVFATGKTSITNATFVDSSLTVRAYGTGADTLTITSSGAITGIKSIDIEDAKLEVKNSSNGQELKLKDGATITSRGTTTISATTISTESGTYNAQVSSGTLTFKESADAGDKLQTLTLGLEGKQGANFVFQNDSSHYHDFEAPNIISYQDSTITANLFNFDTYGANISSSGGELKLIAKDTNGDELNIKHGKIMLNNGGLSYYKDNGSLTLSKLKLCNGIESISIDSVGTSYIEASELSLNGNAIKSSGGILNLKGLSDNSTFGNIIIGDHGGLTATKKSSDIYERTTIKVNSGSTLTLQANAPFTSSSYLLGGGKFGVVQAKTLEFEGSGGSGSPLINIQILHEPIKGEQMFELREGKQIVVQTQEGIFKGVNGTQQPPTTEITLEDISIAPTGYESLKLTAEILQGEVKESNGATSLKNTAIQVTLQALQGTAWEKSESITDTTAKEQMQALIKSHRNEEILDNILLSDNALKAGFSELIAQGDVVTVGNALNYISDTYTSLADSAIFNDRIQTQLAQMQSSAIANRLAHGKNPHKAQEELARFIRSYHNTAYASSDEELPSPEDTPSYKGELWASYDGSMATGNGANSLVNGVMVGYDYDLSESVLLGALVQYGYASFDGGFTHTNSHNVALGIYSRMYFGDNELDVSAVQNFGFNTANIQVGATSMPQQLNGAMEYDVYRTTANLTYGYRFSVGGDEEDTPYYLKPLVGVELAYQYQESGVSDSLVPLSLSAMHSYKVGVSVGLEMRKYFAVGNYMYLTPLVMRDVYSGGSDAEVGFVDTQKMIYAPNYASQTSIGLLAGGEGKVGENLSVNGSLGFRYGVEKTELLTNWSVGLKYKF